MPAPPLRRRRRPFARSAAQTTSRRPARSRIPPATGAARRAVRSGTSTGCSRQTATAAAAEDGAEGRDPPGLARKAGAAPDSAYAGIDSRTQRSSGHTTGHPRPSLAIPWVGSRDTAECVRRSASDGRADRRAATILAAEIQDRERFGAADNPRVRAAAFRANLPLRSRHLRC